MSTIDVELADWATTLQDRVVRNRDKIIASGGEMKYQKMLALARAEDEKAAAAYRAFGDAVSSIESGLQSPSSPKEYLSRTVDATREVLRGIPAGHLRDHVSKRINEEYAHVAEAGKVYSEWMRQFGASYGDPKQIVEEAKHREIPGVVGFVASGFSSFPEFWKAIEPDVRGKGPEAVRDAAYNSGLGQALAALNKDPQAVQMVQGQASYGDRAGGEYLLNKTMEKASEKDRKTITDNMDGFQRLAKARMGYLELAGHLDEHAEELVRAGQAKTFIEARDNLLGLLRDVYEPLQQLHDSLPKLENDEFFMPMHPPDKSSTVLRSQMAGEMARGQPGAATFEAFRNSTLRAMERFTRGLRGPITDKVGEAEIRGAVGAAATPVGDPHKRVAYVFPGSLQAALDDVAILAISTPNFMFSEGVGAFFVGKTGLGKIAQAAARGAIGGGGGMAISPEEMTPGQRVVSSGIGALAGGSIGAAGGALAARGEAAAARNLEQSIAASERTLPAKAQYPKAEPPPLEGGLYTAGEAERVPFRMKGPKAEAPPLETGLRTAAEAPTKRDRIRLKTRPQPPAKLQFARKKNGVFQTEDGRFTVRQRGRNDWVLEDRGYIAETGTGKPHLVTDGPFPSSGDAIRAARRRASGLPTEAGSSGRGQEYQPGRKRGAPRPKGEPPVRGAEVTTTGPPAKVIAASVKPERAASAVTEAKAPLVSGPEAPAGAAPPKPKAPTAREAPTALPESPPRPLGAPRTGAKPKALPPAAPEPKAAPEAVGEPSVFGLRKIGPGRKTYVDPETGAKISKEADIGWTVTRPIMKEGKAVGSQMDPEMYGSLAEAAKAARGEKVKPEYPADWDLDPRTVAVAKVAKGLDVDEEVAASLLNAKNQPKNDLPRDIKFEIRKALGEVPESPGAGAEVSWTESTERSAVKAEFRDRITSGRAAPQMRGGEMYRTSGAPVSEDVPVSPIRRGGAAPKTDDIKLQLQEAAGTAIRTLPQGGRGILGSYRIKTQLTSIGNAQDIPSAFHEFAHHADLTRKITATAPPKALNELLSPQLSKTVPEWALAAIEGTPKKPGVHPFLSDAGKVATRERFAEFVRVAGTNPRIARSLAPNMFKHFVAKLGPKAFRDFAKANTMLRQATGTEALLRPAANVRRPGAEKKIVPHKMPFNAWNRLMRDIFDPTEPQKVATGLYERMSGRKVAPSANPKAYLARYLSSNDAVKVFAESGIRDRMGRIAKDGQTGKAVTMAWQVEPIADMIRQGVPENIAYDAVNSILVSEAAIERGFRKGAEYVTGVGLGVERETPVLAKSVLAARRGVSAELTKDQILLAREAARRVRVVHDLALDRAVNGDLLSQATADELRAMYQHYAHLGRFIEEQAYEPSTRITTNALKKAYGSGRTILSPSETAWSVYATIERAAAFNSWKKSVLQLGRGPRAGRPADYHLIAREVPEPTADSMTLLDRGQLKHVVFDKEIRKMYELMKNPTMFSMGASWASKLNAPLLRGVVLHPKFAVGQLFKELQDSFIKSASGRLIPRMPFKTLKLTRAEIDEFLTAGGGHHGYYADNPIDFARYQQSVTDRLVKAGVTVIDPRKVSSGAWGKYVELLQEFTDVRMKAAEYHRIKREMLGAGWSEADARAEAIMRAREMQDFSLVGRKVMFLTKIIPFMRGRMSGLYSEMTAASRSGRMPLVFFTRGLVVGTTLVGLEEALHAATGTQKELHQMPDYYRDFYFWIPMGKEQRNWVAIPKGWLAGGFTSLARRVYETALMGDKAIDPWGGFWDDLWDRLSPVSDAGELIGGLPGAAIQTTANYSFFKRRNVVPDWEIRRPVEERKGAEEASRTGQFIASHLNALNKGFGLDPRHVDFFIEQSTGITGSTTLGLLDIGRKEGEGKPVPIVGIMRRRPNATRATDAAYKVLRRSGKKDEDLSYYMDKARAAKDEKTRQFWIDKADRRARQIIGKEGW